MHRRHFLVGLAAAPVAVAALPAAARAQAQPGFEPGPGPYGSLDGREPDENGLVLPEGFQSRVVAVAGSEIAGTGLVLRNWLDGGETIAADGGGWIHVRNHELLNGAGGATAIRFSADGEIESATSILDGTTRNCAGGMTPWGTWLSCEEYDRGRVWECDPSGERPAEVRDLLGSFSHEAVAVDPQRGYLYLTEDVPDGRFYRFTPEGADDDLSAGVLEAATVAGDGAVTWAPVDPAGDPVPTRLQVEGSTAFNGGEGIWYDAATDRFLFTTKGDNRVWVFDAAEERIEVLYDAAELGADAPLTGVDNLTVSRSGDVYVAEDGGNMELVLLTPEGEVAPFLRMTSPADQSEVTGPAFSPDGTRLLVAAYGGLAPNENELGRLFEITGPFRAGDGGTAGSTTTIAAAGEGSESAGSSPTSDDESTDVLPIVAGVGVAAAALGGIVVALRRRTGE